MKTFHVVWMIQPDVSTGKDVDAEDMGRAYYKFKEQFPSIEPLYITDKTKK